MPRYKPGPGTSHDLKSDPDANGHTIELDFTVSAGGDTATSRIGSFTWDDQDEEWIRDDGGVVIAFIDDGDTSDGGPIAAAVDTGGIVVPYAGKSTPRSP